MNILLWILQVLLALHTLTGAFWKFSTSEQSDPALAVIPHVIWLSLGVVEIIISIFLILPAVIKSLKILAPIAALFIVFEMLCYIILQLFSGDPNNNSHIIYWLVVAVISGFIAYGRLVSELNK